MKPHKLYFVVYAHIRVQYPVFFCTVAGEVSNTLKGGYPTPYNHQS